MKTEQFSNALTNVDEKYIEEAVNYQAETSTDAMVYESKKERKKAPKGLRSWRGIAIAACAILVAGIGLMAIAANLSMGGASKDAAYEYANEVAPGAGAYVDTEAEEFYYGAEVRDEGIGNYADEKSGDMAGVPEVLANNKIIYSASINMETKEFDKAISDLKSLVNSMSGYFEMEEVNNNSSNYRYAFYKIRIPAERLEAFLAQAGTVCTVKNSNKSAEDVSEFYFDTESRLETATTKLTRLQELLSQAATMEDIITLEREISETEQTIDSYTGTLKRYDSLIDYSTVTIDLQEVYKTSAENQPLTFGQRLSSSFHNSISGFGDFLEDLLVWLAYSWIWLVIVAVIVVIVIIVIKKAVNKKKNQQNHLQ